MLPLRVLSLVCGFLSDQCFCKRCFIECTFDMLKQQPEVISGLRGCGGRRGQWSFSFCHSVSADTPSPPHGLTYTLSTSFFSSLFSPSSYLSKPLYGASPASPHHLTLSLQYLPLPSMSPTLHPPQPPPPPPPPPCCFSAAACLLATTAHPIELSECFYKHTQEDTLLFMHTRRHTFTRILTRPHSYTHRV